MISRILFWLRFWLRQTYAHHATGWLCTFLSIPVLQRLGRGAELDMSDTSNGHFDVPGLKFYDSASKRDMKYVYPDTPHWTAGWILFKHPDGQWVTLRKATEDDIKRISTAVVTAHHKD